MIFYDSARIYFTFNKSKLLNKQMAFNTSNFTLNQPLFINNFDSYLLADTAGTNLSQNASLFNYYKKNNGISLFNNEKTIEGVVVKTSKGRNWKNDPLLKLDEKYASGMFSGGANSFSIDVLHDETAWTKLDVLSYINGKIPGLSLGNFDPVNGRKLLYQGGAVVVFIDEQELTTLEIESLNLDNIAYIKLVPKYFGGRSGDGAGYVPAISIYRKKGDDLIDRRPKETDLNMVKIAGYSALKEFYSPNYSQNNTSGGTDARTTLLWMPYILTDKANRKVPVSFYNNDFTKKMRIVLEGINDDGKMIRIEKIVE